MRAASCMRIITRTSARAKAADGVCCNFLRVHYRDLRERVLQGGTDEEILEWCFEKGRRLNEGDLFVWNGFASKLGWRDSASSILEEAKAQTWHRRSRRHCHNPRPDRFRRRPVPRRHPRLRDLLKRDLSTNNFRRCQFVCASWLSVRANMKFQSRKVPLAKCRNNFLETGFHWMARRT